MDASLSNPRVTIEDSLETMIADRRLTRAGKVRKAQLLEKAAALFARNGYQQTRVVDIMRAAGVSKGLFYWYFENKEALFRELAISTRRRIRIFVAKAVEDEPDPIRRLALAIAASVEFVVDNHEIFSLIRTTTAQEPFTDINTDGARYYTGEIARTILALQKLKLVRKGDAVEMAAGIAGAISAFSALAVSPDAPRDAARLPRDCAEFCLRAITIQPSVADSALEVFDSGSQR